MSPSSLQAGFRRRKQTPVAADRRTGSLTRSLLMVGLVSAFAGTGNASLAAPSDPGRLFYTPAQRVQLESARTRTATPHARQSERSLPDSAPPPLRYDGMVIRSDGKTTRWVNGKPQLDGSDVSGLKPGQVRADGKVYEPYQVLRPALPAPVVKAPAP